MTHEPNPNKMIPLHVADQAVANCEAEITRLRDELHRLNRKGQALAGYLQALANSDTVTQGGDLQRIILNAVVEWDTVAAENGWRPMNR